MKITGKMIDISDRLKFFPEEVLVILKEAGIVAAELKTKVFLVGGMVRDLLLDRDTNDLDLVLTGNPVDYLPVLARALKGSWTYHQQFLTGKIKLSSGYNLDIAATRREHYLYPGALPVVERAELIEDLFRRDYTINTLVLALNPENWGNLIDFFQGRKDIERKIIRIIHRFSFVDDPTRIIRGIRFAMNLGFSFEAETKKLMKETARLGDFSRLTPVRVLKELALLMSDKLNPSFFAILEEIPVFRLLELDFKPEENHLNKWNELESYLAYYQEKNYNIKEWLLRMTIFLQQICDEEIKDWNLSNQDKRILTFPAEKIDLSPLTGNPDPVKIVKTLEDFSVEEILLLMLNAKDCEVKDTLKYYLDKLIKITTEINGKDLQELGITPGPEIKCLLNKIREARVRGQVADREEEMELARRLIKKI